MKDSLAAPCRGSARRWAGRLGAAAFLFFLIKGLLWLAVPGVLAVVAWNRSGDAPAAVGETP